MLWQSAQGALFGGIIKLMLIFYRHFQKSLYKLLQNVKTLNFFRISLALEAWSRKK
jgi:hypothetical protein